MNVVIEIKHDKSVDVIYYRAGFIKNNKFTNISEIPGELIKNKEIVLVIPDSWLITKSLTVPFDIRNILAIKSYLAKSLSLGLDDLYSNYFIFGNKLYFVAVKRENLNDFVKVVRRLGGKLKTVLPKSFIFKLFLNLNSPKHFCFNFDRDYLSIFSFEGNGYFFFVVLPYGSNSFVDLNEELQITKFINEIYRFVSSFQGQTKISIEEFHFFVDKEYKELPVLSSISKVFQGISFITMDDGKYLDTYSKVLEYKDNFPINLSVDKFEEYYRKENLIQKLDLTVNFLIVLLVLLLIFVFFTNSDKISKEKMIVEALKNNYQNQLTLFSYQKQGNVRKYVYDFGFYRFFNTLNELTNRQVYIENFDFKDNIVNFYFVSPKYSDIYLLAEELKKRGFNVNVEGNTKFIVFEKYELNRSVVNYGK